ncbi:MAG: diguanylate cyclase [Cyanobacteria bacterium J06560_6]
MSILSEQSIASSGLNSPKGASSGQSTELEYTALPTHSTLETAQKTKGPFAAKPLPAIEQQRRLRMLAQNPAIYSGDADTAAAVITQSAAEVLGIDRVSLWLCKPGESLQLADRYDLASQTHQNGTQLLVADYPAYFETLNRRDGLLVEGASSSSHGAESAHRVIQALVQAEQILPGSFLEMSIRVQGEVVGVLWCESILARRWTALEQASAVSLSLLAATAIETQQRLLLTGTLSEQHRQLKRETIEREQAEQAWQESQRFIQGIIDASTNILYVDSFADGSNFYINRWIQNVLGYTPGDIQKLGPRYLESLVHADEKALMATERRKLSAINDGEVVENEYRFRHRQGNWRWLLCRETVFQRDEDGQPTQIFGTATDITKRKHAEVALKEFNEELARLARMDGLTQVANRRSFDEYLAQEWENIGSGRSALSLILCDIDYFKSFNDTYGHQAGDVCLRRVAKAIEHAVKRNTDLVARYGGEEFAIILPNTNEAGVQQVAKEIQKAVETLNVPHSQSDVSECITLSLGLASISCTTNAHPDMLVASADQGLYQAKYNGRNRFCIGEIEYP